MDPSIFFIFVAVYAGMMLGRIPGLAVDRTGVALLGAIALLATGRMSTASALLAVDVPTLGLLFGLMVISAQLRLGGFYAEITSRIASADLSPGRLMLVLVLVVGALSAVLANDIVCLAMAPLLAEGCARRGLDPVPYLIGLAASSNVGSAATLIGNPQNMLIGQTLGLSFRGYLLDGAVPAGLGLLLVWGVMVLLWRNRWRRSVALPPADSRKLDLWQTAKGLVVIVGVVGAFLFAPWPREVVALAGAGVLLASRRTASRNMLALVDWQLLVLFIGLFVVNRAVLDTGMVGAGLGAMASYGLDLARPPVLFAATAVLSNLVSNVPAVMLLLPAATHPMSGPAMALASTLAGNLILVGSIANLIVVDQAARLGIPISWRTHARAGIPITLGTLALAVFWLLVRA